jgi:hypothetical protein
LRLSCIDSGLFDDDLHLVRLWVKLNEHVASDASGERDGEVSGCALEGFVSMLT